LRIPGVDVYSGYGIVDWDQVAAAGHRFAFLKTAEGNEPARDDSQYVRNVKGCKAAGIYPGAYFFPYPLPPDIAHNGRDPVEQAERFFRVSAGLGLNTSELPPVMDAEWPEIGKFGRWGCTAQQVSDWLREFCEHTSCLWNRRPIIYTYPFWWNSVAMVADVAWAKDYPLWIASYNHITSGTPPEEKKPTIPKPWDDWLFWQYSAKGSHVRVPGIDAVPVDRDCFNGDIAALRRLARVNGNDFDIVHPLHYEVP